MLALVIATEFDCCQLKPRLPERAQMRRSPLHRRTRRPGSRLFNGRDLAGWIYLPAKARKNHDPDRVEFTIEDVRNPPLQARRRRRGGRDGIHRHGKGLRRLPPPIPVSLGHEEVQAAVLPSSATQACIIISPVPDAVWPKAPASVSGRADPTSAT